METKDHLYLYPYSFAEAKSMKEIELWKESHKDNIACKNAIEDEISKGFDGMRLNADCAKNTIEHYGFKRVAFVLANSLKHKEYDGRFSSGNKEWANKIFVPKSEDKGINHSFEFMVDSHPAVLDGFVNQFRRAYQRLGMFDNRHCLPNTDKQNFEGKVIVMKPDRLKESCYSQHNQLWFCTGGFGFAPNSRGRAVFVTCLADGEKTRFNREDFIGVLADCHLPMWASEKLGKLDAQMQNELESFEGIKMK